MAGRRLAAASLAWLAGVAVPAAGAIPAEQIAEPPPVRTIDAPFSFAQAPFVHPRIVQDLTTWWSDTGDQVVAVNLTDSNWSNRYHGEVEASSARCPIVPWEEPEGVRFHYQYVGMTDAGVHVLRISESGGRSVFETVLFFVLELDYGFDHGWNNFWSLPAATPTVPGQAGARIVRPDRQRVVLRKLGSYALGDRWFGDLAVRGNDLLIGADRYSGPTSRREPRPQGRLRIEAKPTAPLDFAAHAGGCATETRTDP